MPSPFPCSPVVRECSWKKTQTKKDNEPLILRMSVLGITYSEKHKCSTQYNIVGIKENFYSVHSLAISTSVITATSTSRKYLPIINLWYDLYYRYYMVLYYRYFIYFFINLHNLHGIAEMFCSLYRVSFLQELGNSDFSLVILSNVTKMTVK